MFQRFKSRAISASLLTLAVSAFLSGQTAPTGALAGAITDPSGGAISGAKISAVEQKTSSEHSTLADAAGQYSFPALPVGSYTLKAEFPGFTPYEKKDVAVTAAGSSAAIIIPPPARTT